MRKKLAAVFCTLTVSLNATEVPADDQSRVYPSHRYVLEVTSHRADMHAFMGQVNVLNPQYQTEREILLGWNAKIVEINNSQPIEEGFYLLGADSETGEKKKVFLALKGGGANVGTNVVLSHNNVRVGQQISCQRLLWVPFAQMPKSAGETCMLYYAEGLFDDIAQISPK